MAVCGARWFTEGYKDRSLQDDGAAFFMEFVYADCDHIAIENPVCIMSTRYRKPDQIIQPYEFGHYASKATCLWLKNLPALRPTKFIQVQRDKWGYVEGTPQRQVYDENGKALAWDDPRTAKVRSKTFKGIADAMANQWAACLESEYKYDTVGRYDLYKLF